MRTSTMKMLAVALLAMPVATFADDEGDIKYRQAVMKGIAGHAGAISQIAKGNVSHTDVLGAHADALLALSKMVPAAYKNETSGESASKPEVWSDRAGFEGKASDFEKASMAVAEAAKAGPDAVKGTLGDLFDTCKACHKDYRVKKD